MFRKYKIEWIQGGFTIYYMTILKIKIFYISELVLKYVKIL